MFISPVLSPFPNSNTTPSSQDSKDSKSEVTEPQPSSQAEPTVQENEPAQTEPAQTGQSIATQPVQQPIEATSQTVFEASNKNEVTVPSQDSSDAQSAENVANSEAAARAAAEAYRATAQQTAILERNASSAASELKDARLTDAEPMTNLRAVEATTERKPVNILV